MDYETILITGGAGFVGSNMALSFKEKYPSINIIAMDNLRRRGSELNLARLREGGVVFIHGDIRNPEDFPAIPFNALLECSAEPSVLAGYEGNSLYVINTNLTGTVNCLEEARKYKASVVFLSTSRVYPYEKINSIDFIEDNTRFIWKKDLNIQGWSQEGISEDFSLEGPRSLYGTSKLCSELILQEYISMYGIGGVINRCGVIAGPWQFGKADQGVFTLWMLSHYFKRDLKYIGFGGKGKQVRDLVHIYDIIDLVEMELKSMDKVNGKVYNAGGGRGISLSLSETTAMCEKITGNKINIGRDEKNRPADVPVYLGDNKKIRSDLGWSPSRSPEKILEDIFLWIKENEKTILKSLF